MDSLIDLYRQTKAAQSRAERAGFLDTAAALARIAEMVAQQANMDGDMIRPIALGAAVPLTSTLHVCGYARR